MARFLKIKVKSSAIQYALVLCVMFSFILGGLVLYSGSYRKLNTSFNIQQQLRQNASSGIEYAKEYLNELDFNSSQTISLFNTGADSVIITKENWGAFPIVNSKAIHENLNFDLTAFMGIRQKEKLINLYVADNESALALCGETRIEGLCFLPRRGVKRAYIANQNYTGEKLIYGTSKTAEKELPKINTELINAIQKPILAPQKEYVKVEEIANSFKNEPVYYFSAGPIFIENTAISGKIIIESGDSIFISKNCTLDQVIIRAPVVYVESGFSGNLQIYASHKIILESDVVLKYPSVLGLLEESSHENVSTIDIGDGSVVIGSVFLTTNQTDFRKEVFLNCQPESKIVGLAYCKGKTQLKGEIVGQIYTNRFYLNTASSVYENHLLNANISNKLPAEFLVIPLLEKGSFYNTLAWLN